MHRFYVPKTEIVKEYTDQGKRNTYTVVIRDEEFRHLARVLRLTAGESISVFDGEGGEYPGVILSLDQEEALVRLEEPLFCPRESPLEVWLVQGLPKGEKMELIIQKATELGVRGIIPLATQRSLVKLAGKKAAERQKRWQRVALEAAKQCRRALIPEVVFPCSLEEFLQSLPLHRHLFVPWEEGGRSLKKVLLEAAEQEMSQALPVYLLIGPEGGLAAQEVAQMQSQGALTITLGPRILRTETAGLAALAAIMFAWGDWEG